MRKGEEPPHLSYGASAGTIPRLTNSPATSDSFRYAEI